jgi:hypothetical protein
MPKARCQSFPLIAFPHLCGTLLVFFGPHFYAGYYENDAAVRKRLAVPPVNRAVAHAP